MLPPEGSASANNPPRDERLGPYGVEDWMEAILRSPMGNENPGERGVRLSADWDGEGLSRYELEREQKIDAQGKPYFAYTLRVFPDRLEGDYTDYDYHTNEQRVVKRTEGSAVLAAGMQEEADMLNCLRTAYKFATPADLALTPGMVDAFFGTIASQNRSVGRGVERRLRVARYLQRLDKYIRRWKLPKPKPDPDQPDQ